MKRKQTENASSIKKISNKTKQTPTVDFVNTEIESKLINNRKQSVADSWVTGMDGMKTSPWVREHVFIQDHLWWKVETLNFNFYSFE